MIGIVDYGLGNVARLRRHVYERMKVPAALVTCEAGLARADKIILPGVGAFDWAMERLAASGMIECLNELVLSERRRVLGVCGHADHGAGERRSIPSSVAWSEKPAGGRCLGIDFHRLPCHGVTALTVLGGATTEGGRTAWRGKVFSEASEAGDLLHRHLPNDSELDTLILVIGLLGAAIAFFFEISEPDQDL